MASRKFLQSKPKYIDPIPNTEQSTDHFEFDESDIWNSNHEIKKQIPSSSKKKKFQKKIKIASRNPPAMSVSLPVNIPDWSKMSKDEKCKGGDGEIGGGGAGWIPPHKYLERNRGDSSSVQEGVGRTLKGRDLRRVRNAIWEKIGFED